MSNVAKLKKQAAELELKKQFDKALAIYIKLLESFDENASELDVALFNRVGDLLMRQGNVADAVDYYERAVDLYGETGFFNNAIALCNKILRHSPGRASVYYKLGKISAQKGFKNDAKVNFLEYADRMQKAGKVNEAFRALKEFADLCPDQDEIRLMLADQLTKADRKSEAIEQLQTLHERYDSEGRVAEAAATAVRMRSIDPSVEPRSSGGGRRKTISGELVFLDLDTPSGSGSFPRQLTPPRPPAPAPAPPRPPATAAPRPSAPAPAPAPRHPTPAPQKPELPADIVLISTDSVIETPPSVPTIEDPLADIMLADVSLGVVKSTPTSSLFAVESPEESDLKESSTLTPMSSDIVDEPAADLTPLSSAVIDEPIATPTPMSSPIAEVRGGTPIDSPAAPRIAVPPATLKPTPSLIDLGAELLGGPGTTPIDRSPAPTHSAHKQEPAAKGHKQDLAAKGHKQEPATKGMDGFEFIMPGAESLYPPDTPLIDFDPSALTTPPMPSTPAGGPATPARPTPHTTRVALEGLPLMDLEIPDATPPSNPHVPNPRDRLPLTTELDLIEPPAREVKSAATDDSIFIDLNDESLTSDDDDSIVLPTPSVARKSTMVAAHSVEILRASVEAEPENWSLHRELAEAMLEAGNRDGGISELELAMSGAERSGDLDLASSLAEEIARLEPDVVRHHQKRVEYAFRTNDRSRLIEAYVALADSLLASDQADKARTVYQRVLDLAPDDVRARTAIDTIAVPEPEPLRAPSTARASTQRRASVATSGTDVRAAALEADSFVNLGDWLRGDAAPRDTRMVVDEQEPSGDEEADFADMLRKFKQGIAENVDPEDYQSHYDLAIAFKEMGLLDEAIAEFQKALGGPTNRLPTYEALGQCFLDKMQFKLATSILSRSLNEKATEEQLVGVLYLLGRSAEAQGLAGEAQAYYHRVFVLDIQFRDVADRLDELERALR